MPNPHHTSAHNAPGHTEWEIRQALPTDADEIRRVVIEAGVAAWGEFLGEERIRNVNQSIEHPADLVAEDAHGVFAFVAWDEASGEIQRLYTHPRGWGSGASAELLDRALDALRNAGVDQAWLNTEERNERAIRFYENHGWRRDGGIRIRDWRGTQLWEPRFVKDLNES